MKTYYDKQIEPIIQAAKLSEFNAKLQLSLDGIKTNHIDVSANQLKQILYILNKGR